MRLRLSVEGLERSPRGKGAMTPGVMAVFCCSLGGVQHDLRVWGGRGWSWKLEKWAESHACIAADKADLKNVPRQCD